MRPLLNSWEWDFSRGVRTAEASLGRWVPVIFSEEKHRQTGKALSPLFSRACQALLHPGIYQLGGLALAKTYLSLFKELLPGSGIAVSVNSSGSPGVPASCRQGQGCQNAIMQSLPKDAQKG